MQEQLRARAGEAERPPAAAPPSAATETVQSTPAPAPPQEGTQQAHLQRECSSMAAAVQATAASGQATQNTIAVSEDLGVTSNATSPAWHQPIRSDHCGPSPGSHGSNVQGLTETLEAIRAAGRPPERQVRASTGGTSRGSRHRSQPQRAAKRFCPPSHEHSDYYSDSEADGDYTHNAASPELSSAPAKTAANEKNIN